MIRLFSGQMKPLARHLDNCHSIEDLRCLARRRLPRMFFDFLDGGSDDEQTLQRNRSGFTRYLLHPKVLVDVADIDTSTTLLGRPISLPIVVSPTGLPRLWHNEGEYAIARAARQAGTIYTVPCMGSRSIEDVAKNTDGPLWFQVYVWRDRSLIREFFSRCRDQGYAALCLTVDVPVLGNRERDLRHGLTIPPKLKLRSIANAATRPNWWWRYLMNERPTMANVVGRGQSGRDDIGSLSEYVKAQFDASVTWKDLEWMLAEWNGPFAVKGIVRPDDAVRAVDMGVRAIVISNHGGRQLDGGLGSIDALPAIVDAVGDRAEVILDGGIRRGSDVVKALALGARACMTGRPFLYGMSVAGQAGVERAFELLTAELQRTLALVGCQKLDELDRSFVGPAPG